MPSDRATSTPVVVLSDADHLTAAKDRSPELTDPAGQDGLEEALEEREDVVVAGREVADVQECPGEPLHGMHLPLGQEPLRDAPLIEHLDRAGEKTPGSRSVDSLRGAAFDDRDIDPRERELARQHQPRRATSCDQDLMLRHAHTRTGYVDFDPRISLLPFPSALACDP